MADEPKDGMVQISQADLTVMQNAYNTLNAMWTNKDHATDFKRLLKKVKPDTNIPELDITDRYVKPLEEKLTALETENQKTRKELEDDRKARKDEKDLSDVYGKIDVVVKKRGLTDEGRAGMIKVMQDRQIADPEAAALIYLDGLPKTKVTKAGGVLPSAMNMFGVDDDKDSEFEAFWKNPVKAQDKVIAQILNEAEAA